MRHTLALEILVRASLMFAVTSLVWAVFLRLQDRRRRLDADDPTLC